MEQNNGAVAKAPEGSNVKVVKKQKPKNHTGLAKFTYLLALLCLIAGLALPIGMAFDDYLNNTLFWQLPAAVNIILGQELLTFGAPQFMMSLPINLFGVLEFDLGAYLMVLYALITVLGVIWLLIGVLPSKKAGSCVAKASFIEGFALLFLLPYVLIFICPALLEDLADEIAIGEFLYAFLPILIAAGGTFLMVLVQAFAYKKSSGFMKLIMLVFSGLAFLLILPYQVLVPFLSEPMQSLCDMLGGKFVPEGFVGSSIGYYYFFTILYSNPVEAFGNMELYEMIVSYAALALSVLVVINVILDALGLAKKTNKGMLRFNVLRYLLTVLVAGATIGIAIWQNITVGLPLLFIAVLALLQLIINIIRSSTYTKRKKAALAQQRKQQKIEKQQQLYGRAPTKGYAGDAAAATAYLQGSNERRAQAQADREARRQQKQEQRDKEKAEREAKLAAEKEKAKPAAQENYYNVTQIYKGPTDEFIKELTNDEKIEFAKVFLERRDVISEIPEYIIGGNNEKFFSSIFVYYGRMCDVVSSALMGKIYECGYKKH